MIGVVLARISVTWPNETVLFWKEDGENTQEMK